MPSNILFITADDLSGDTPGAFGGPPGVTPTLDRLAEEGLCFRRAHVAVAICQPSRSAIMTGKWPHRNGAEGFQPISSAVTPLTDLLREAQYRVGILGKVEHLAPVDRFGWDLQHDRPDLGMGRNPARYARYAAEFMAAAASNDQPWFLMANTHDPHRPFAGSDQESERFTAEQRATIPEPSKVFQPDHAPVPGFLPDLPPVRHEYAEYLSSARRCDDVVAALLETLDASGQADNTLVVFLSDNGMAFPFAKSNCYLQSTRTPMIIRWPGRTRPGSTDELHFVSSLDLFPTFCAAAGGLTPPDDLDGRSLEPLIAGDREDDRNRIFTVFHETAGKRRYEMRCVQDATYGYIWNAWSDGVTDYGRVDNMSGRTWPAIQEASDADPALAERAGFYRHRCPEELYDLRTDPNGLTNLASDPAHRSALIDLRRHLGDHLTATDDPLAEQFRQVAPAP